MAGGNGAATNGFASGGRQVTFLEAIRQAMFEEMERDPTVLLMGEDVGVYGGAFKTSEGLLERFGWERVIDTPINESAIIGAGIRPRALRARPLRRGDTFPLYSCARYPLSPH